MKKVLLLISVMLFVTSSSYAIITDEESMEYDYIINHGYSVEMARLIHLKDDQINARSLDTSLYQPKIHPLLAYPPGSWLRALWIYIDPSYDAGDFGVHDTKYSPHYKDL